MGHPALLARIFALAIVTAQQNLWRSDEQLLKRHPIAIELMLPQSRKPHPFGRQPGGRHSAPAATEPDRIYSLRGSRSLELAQLLDQPLTASPLAKFGRYPRDAF